MKNLKDVFIPGSIGLYGESKRRACIDFLRKNARISKDGYLIIKNNPSDFDGDRLNVWKLDDKEIGKDKIKPNPIIQNLEICWKRWNPNDRTCEMNVKPVFIRFKGESKVTIIPISKLYCIGKNVTDIDWIAEIPKEFEISNLSILK